MKQDPARRSKLANFAIQEKNWKLEQLKSRQRAASERYASAATAANELARKIDQSQEELNRALNDETALDLDTIQSARAYLFQCHDLQQEYNANLRNAAVQAAQADVDVRHAALTVRALEQVKGRADQEVRRALETRSQESDIELWMQSALNGDGDDR